MLLVIADQLIVVSVKVKCFQFAWIRHDLTKLVESRDFIIWVVILTLARVPDNLSSKFVALVMDPCLVKNVKILGSSGSEIFIRDSNLQEGNRRKVDFLAKQILFDDLATSRQFLAKTFHLGYKFFGFTRAETTDKLEHAVHVFMLANKVYVNADFVDNLDVDLFEAISESCLVHPLLHRI